jgi:hypothetical protein
VVRDALQKRQPDVSAFLNVPKRNRDQLHSGRLGVWK